MCVCVMHHKRAHTRIHSDTHAHAEAGRRPSLFEEGNLFAAVVVVATVVSSCGNVVSLRVA